jgi:hypothetical protein
MWRSTRTLLASRASASCLEAAANCHERLTDAMHINVQSLGSFGKATRNEVAGRPRRQASKAPFAERLLKRSGQSPCGAPLLESLDVGVGEQERVARYLRFLRLAQHEAEDVLYLRLPTPFDVS